MSLTPKEIVRRENLTVGIFIAIMLILVNPPVVYWVNSYVRTHPLTWCWPTLWLWLQLWYMVMLGGIVFFAVRFKSWNVELIEEEVIERADAGGNS